MLHMPYRTTRPRVVLFCGTALLAQLLGCAGPAVEDKPSPAAALEAKVQTAPGYRVERYPKIEGQYTRLGAEQVQIGPYRMARIEREDADAFYVRVYEPIVVSAPPAAPVTVPRADLEVSKHFHLRTFDRGLPREAQWRDELAIADIDGDGQLDIVSTPPRKSMTAPVIFRGDGAGNWARWSGASFPKLGYDYGGVAVADLDHDGRLDLALAMHLRGFAVLRQMGNGQFERMDDGLPQIEAVAQHGMSGTALALAHSSDESAQLLLFDERLRPATITGPRPLLRAYRWHVAQWQRVDLPAALERSKLVQLIAAHRSAPGLWLLLPDSRDGSGWQAARLLDGAWTFHSLPAVPEDCQPITAAVADVDGDGKADFALSCQRLLAQQWWSQVELLRSAAGPLTLQAGTALETVKRMRFVQAGRNSAPDLAMLGEQGVLEIRAADKRSGYTLDHQEPVPDWRAGCRGFALHSLDLDHDGTDELIASFAGEASVFERGPGCRGGGGISVWKLERH